MNNKKKEKSIAEQNKDFRLTFRGIDLMESRNYDVDFDFVLGGEEYCNLFITPDNIQKTLRIYLDKEDILKLHEKLCITYIHLHDTDARKKLNEIVDDLRV